MQKLIIGSAKKASKEMRDNWRPALGNMKIFMKAGDQMYINGANIKVDRKVSIELLNKSKFLLKSHMLKVEEADSPLKQLYFAIQLMIVNSADPSNAQALYKDLMRSILADESSNMVHKLIREIDEDVINDREFKALQTIKSSLADKVA